MARYERHYAGANGWSRWVFPRRRGYKHACCDCGLVHQMQFRLVGRHIEFRSRRLPASTGQIRRWMR
jgi:hypothetical protein